ncbi:MAG: Selenophosphate-dependent tRNA 2-selenouridine synthase [uncultured Thiotrichaceae bacterium]|uniref:tRNA 2-selenouridine synthase n=1 Tax=uncultured Thiotrichaceae bacterium TaxID=298394 RepID=A0A6S6SPT7_9GAMM|nr:MAG: Selenophosphate-dependent tRNA 2-selenouridine synthase [uncultured Thiotrichaceae bacterium]
MIKFSTDLPLLKNLADVFTQDTPLLDVRAPVEYTQGAFPHTRNVPLMNDQERHEVGVRYKEQGQDEAIVLGEALLTPELREARIGQWVQFFKDNPQGALYCFRGGMRSKITQQWIFDTTGIRYPRIEGGYKAMRRYLIDMGDVFINDFEFTLLSGRTGSGKTRFLHKTDQMIDLEGLANHRGSAFGRKASPQPTQIDFENQLYIELLKYDQVERRSILLEDEGRNVGSVHLPHSLTERMAESPIIFLEVSDDERLEVSIQEYAIDAREDYTQIYGETVGFEKYKEALLGSLERIQKRLGGVRYQELRKLLMQALEAEEKGQGVELHEAWMSRILFEYYDPMYDYQIEKKKERIIFRGNSQEIAVFWSESVKP